LVDILSQNLVQGRTNIILHFSILIFGMTLIVSSYYTISKTFSLLHQHIAMAVIGIGMGICVTSLNLIAYIVYDSS